METTQTLTLDSLGDSPLQVVEPFQIEIIHGESIFIADAPEVNDYGEGETVEEAIRDLQASIVELFTDLDEDKDRLGPGLQIVYETLLRKLRRINADNGA